MRCSRAGAPPPGCSLGGCRSLPRPEPPGQRSPPALRLPELLTAPPPRSAPPARRGIAPRSPPPPGKPTWVPLTWAERGCRRRGAPRAVRSLRRLQRAGRAARSLLRLLLLSVPDDFHFTCRQPGCGGAGGSAAFRGTAVTAAARSRTTGGAGPGRTAQRPRVPPRAGAAPALPVPAAPKGRGTNCGAPRAVPAPPRVRRQRDPTIGDPRPGMLSPRRLLACSCRVGIAPVLSITSSVRGYKYLLGIPIAASS